jgi:phospholipase/carboxylesterase
MSILEYKVVEPLGEHCGTAIWFHGMGQTPDSFMQLIESLDLASQGIRCVLPYAPVKHRSMAGLLVPIWFNRLNDDLFKVDPISLNLAVDQAHQLIRDEAQFIDASRITLCGFSQGGALALSAGLRYENPLRGVALYAPTPLNATEIRSMRNTEGSTMPCWIGHGVEDDVILASESEKLAACLLSSGYPVNFHICAGAHEPFSGMDIAARSSLHSLITE